jgi:hypothetical protein
VQWRYADRSYETKFRLEGETIMYKFKNSLIAFASLMAMLGITGMTQAALAGTERSGSARLTAYSAPALAVAANDLSAATLKQLARASVSSYSAPEPTPVTITAVFDFSTFPDVAGTFTTSGALAISGVATMHVGFNADGTRAHCVVTLIASDGTGTIIIHQECQFATDPAKGRWEIVGGTGDYANLRGNGSLLMPPNEEAMTGVIY